VIFVTNFVLLVTCRSLWVCLCHGSNTPMHVRYSYGVTSGFYNEFFSWPVL